MNKPKYVIVVGIDYAMASERALDEAFALATTKHGVQLHIVNVRPAFGVQIPFHGRAGAAATLARLGHGAARVRCSQGHGLSGHGRGSALQAPVHASTHDDPAQELVQLAADVEADLLVVGTHDWHGVARLGSVAEAVSRAAPCPVLVVRRKALACSSKPAIEPPCPACIASRNTSNGEKFWCEQHSERHGRRHTYHQTDRAGARDELSARWAEVNRD